MPQGWRVGKSGRDSGCKSVSGPAAWLRPYKSVLGPTVSLTDILKSETKECGKECLATDSWSHLVSS